jgi:hypothetical protein
MGRQIFAGKFVDGYGISGRAELRTAMDVIALFPSCWVPVLTPDSPEFLTAVKQQAKPPTRQLVPYLALLGFGHAVSGRP